MSTIATLLNTVKNAVWKNHPRCGSCGAWTKADGVCHNPRCDHHGKRTAVVGATPAATGNTHKAQQNNLPKTWQPMVRTAAVNLAKNNEVTLPDGKVLAWLPEAKTFTLDGIVIKAASGGQAVRAAYAQLTGSPRKFQDAIAAFTPDLAGDPMKAYREMKQDAENLHRLAHEAGVSLNPGPGFCADIRKGLARQVKQSLEKLPAETLRQIAYAEGFTFPTLTQDPDDTKRPSSLVYWLNPIYKPGTAKVVQKKAMERWNERSVAEQVETLVGEATLHRSLDKAGYTAPSPAAKYAGLMPKVADMAKVRLTDLHTRIEKTAWKLARQHGTDRDDVAAEIRLAILEKGEQDPGFLLQTNSYVLTHGVWAVKRQARNDRRFQADKLDDELDPVAVETSEIVPDTAAVLASLPAELRQVVELMLTSPADYLIGAGKINKTKLAEDLGMSWHAANARLEQIQNIVGSMFSPAAMAA